MPTPLRYIPEEAKLWTDSQGRRIAIVEVTIRCIMGTFLLAPRPEHVRIVRGVLAKALKELDFELFGYAFLSNHGSMLYGVRDAVHLATIMPAHDSGATYSAQRGTPSGPVGAVPASRASVWRPGSLLDPGRIGRFAAQVRDRAR